MRDNGTMALKKTQFRIFPAMLIVLLFGGDVWADDAFFDRDYAAGGIVRPDSDRIAPVVVAPESPADQMLQTEAKPERRDIVPPSAQPSNLVRPKSYPGRFVTRQAGTESRRIPQALGEVGTDLP